MSPPAQKFLPRPLTSTARMPGAPWQAMMARQSASRNSALIAFEASGRLSVMRARPSSTEKSTRSSAVMRFLSLEKLTGSDQKGEGGDRLVVFNQRHLLAHDLEVIAVPPQHEIVSRRPDDVAAQRRFE